MNGKASSEDLSPVLTQKGHRFPRENRMLSREYQTTFNTGKSFVCRYFVMWLSHAEDSVIPDKVGMVASKRTFPHAVGRNRARRLLRTAYRVSRDHFVPGVRMVLIGRARILEVKSGVVLREFRRLCKKARIWKGER